MERSPNVAELFKPHAQPSTCDATEIAIQTSGTIVYRGMYVSIASISMAVFVSRHMPEASYNSVARCGRTLSATDRQRRVFCYKFTLLPSLMSESHRPLRKIAVEVTRHGPRMHSAGKESNRPKIVGAALQLLKPLKVELGSDKAVHTVQ